MATRRKTAKTTAAKSVEALKHEDKRKNIPTAEHQSVLDKAQQAPTLVRYPRNTDLDPQLVWRGKDEQDYSDLVVHAPPLYIQEKVHPKALIDDLMRRPKEAAHEAGELTPDLFADFNGIAKGVDKTEFYQHDQNWSNRMILGDSLQVMASLAEREGLRGKVQCIYFDPPYGIKFNSNFQWSTTSRDVKDGKAEHITREPEQVKAFRDTWRDGIHSYLTYLRDRLTVARDLLTESGSIFVQIGDENVHRIRALMDEVFGETNFVSLISVKKSSAQTSALLSGSNDYLCWYARDSARVKYRQLYLKKGFDTDAGSEYRYALTDDGKRVQIPLAYLSGAEPLPAGWRAFRPSPLTSQGYRTNTTVPFEFEGKTYHPGPGANWKTTIVGMKRLVASGRIIARKKSLSYLRLIDDHPVFAINNVWEDTKWGFDARDKTYIVQTNTKVLVRCLQMTSDPGDLVLDPTCGSGTTAVVAEQLGRRWITIDTSRVALALARARTMGARYPSYLLKDSEDGQLKEAEILGTAPGIGPRFGDVRHGFVYERVPHITLKSISNNAEIDVIWEKWQQTLEPLRQQLNAALETRWQEWEIPRDADAVWSDAAKKLHTDWRSARIACQQEIDKSIAAKAEFEYLYDRPYENRRKVRVAGPFTVESLSPHRMLGIDENDELIDPGKVNDESIGTPFDQMILENLKAAGVQQAHKEDRIVFTSLMGWPGTYICAEGRYLEGETEKRAGIFIGPEFGTVSRPDLVEAAREAGDAGFNVLIACAFNYDAHANELDKLGRITVLKARMNADLHMAADLKTTGKGNLFVIFGEPDITVSPVTADQIRVKVNGVDVFDPSSGDVRSDGSDGIACWFIDTDYNGESFFVRHAYFLGQNDPYKALRTTLKAEINEEAWETLHSDTSRPFPKPKSGRIAVKVINHLGDEVMKVFRV